MQPPPGIPRANRGFTLLELLIATGVAAIVLLVINGTYFGALRLYNATNERTDATLVSSAPWGWSGAISGG